MDTLSLARELIRRPSVSPADAGCQVLIGELLEAAGFVVERLRFGEVDNLWARRGRAAPALVFAGHTDVVPTGPPEQWDVDPFAATVWGDRLIGRGAADMKGSLAAMINACRRFAERYPQFSGSIGLLITSDEEGAADDGTLKVMETLARARRDVSVLRRRRALERGEARRHGQDRPPRQPVRHHDDPRRARPRRLSARRSTTRSTRSRSSSPR